MIRCLGILYNPITVYPMNEMLAPIDRWAVSVDLGGWRIHSTHTK